MTIQTVTLDLDGTLLPDTTAFAEILRQFGKADEVAASDSKFFAGEISLAQCFQEQWAWVQELSLQDMHRALRKAAWLDRIGEGVRMLTDAGFDVRMLTDQPSVITDFGSRWGLGPAICSPVKIHEGHSEAIDFREDKLENLRSAGLDPKQVCHVGNGSNDVPIWNAGALGVATFAEPSVAANATVNLGRPESLVHVAEAILSAAGSRNPP